MDEQLEFDSLEPIKVAVKIGKDSYVLQEASEASASEFQNAQMRATRENSTENLADTRSLLVSRCLFKDGAPVALTTIRAWPGRIVEPLFQRAKEISNLVDKPTVESIEAKIEALEKQLMVLRKPSENGKPTEGAAKNSRNATAATSA